MTPAAQSPAVSDATSQRNIVQRTCRSLSVLARGAARNISRPYQNNLFTAVDDTETETNCVVWDELLPLKIIGEQLLSLPNTVWATVARNRPTPCRTRSTASTSREIDVVSIIWSRAEVGAMHPATSQPVHLIDHSSTCMRYVMHLVLATDRFKCTVLAYCTCLVSLLKYSELVGRKSRIFVRQLCTLHVRVFNALVENKKVGISPRCLAEKTGRAIKKFG